MRFLVRNASGTDINFVAGAIREGANGEHGVLPDGRTLAFSRFFGSPGMSYDNTVIHGTAELQLWGVPPGSAGVACVPKGSSVRKLFSAATFDVVDLAGIYVSVELPCDDAQSYGMLLGPTHDVADWLRGRLLGLRESDVVEPAEYTNQRTPVLQVIRNHVTVAVARLYRGFEGIFTACHGSDLRPTGGFAPP